MSCRQIYIFAARLRAVENTTLCDSSVIHHNVGRLISQLVGHSIGRLNEWMDSAKHCHCIMFVDLTCVRGVVVWFGAVRHIVLWRGMFKRDLDL